MPDPLDGPDGVIRDDLDAVVRGSHGDLGALSGTSLLLTGSTGFVGRFLVETVLWSNELGAGPACIVTLPTRRPDVVRGRYPKAVAAGELDVVEWGTGRAFVLPGRRPDYVIHGAATTDPLRFREDPEGSFRDTVAMAESVAGIARAARRVVLISSGAVYGDQPADLPGFPEMDEPPSVGPPPGPSYAAAKRESERRLGEIDVDLRIARVFSLIGPYQDLGSAFAVPDLIRQADRDGVLTLTTDGSARRSFCYATDLAAILFWLLLSEPHHDVYNVGSRDGTASIAKVAATIAEIFGGLEVRRADGPGSQRDYVPELSRLYAEYAPTVGLREGLIRTCHSLFARGVIGRRPAVELGR